MKADKLYVCVCVCNLSERFTWLVCLKTGRLCVRMCVCVCTEGGLPFESLFSQTETGSLPVVTEIEPNLAPQTVTVDESTSH